MPNLILASQSPRRRELLTTAGLRFTVRSRPVAEMRGSGEDPRVYVTRLARAKADASWQGESDEIILGADTVVVLDERVLEKPADAEDASAMLRSLSGRTHIVITGICLRHSEGSIVDIASTKVRFGKLEDREIEEYVQSGEPMDKAGAYAIQGLASKFVEHVDGCFFNVIGLPLALVYRYWKKLAE